MPKLYNVPECLTSFLYWHYKYLIRVKKGQEIDFAWFSSSVEFGAPHMFSTLAIDFRKQYTIALKTK